ncbi:MAG: DUF5123 domain-containing protein [Prevotella sp.]|nr:DUF5123 domain-containing protein [Prevotella sp.]
MKKLFAMAAFAAAAVTVSAEVTPRSPIVPWGAQAEIIITNDLTQQNSDGSWALTADARQWIEYSYDGSTENGTIQQTNRPNVWFDFYSEETDTMVIAADHNWGGYLTVTSKTGSTSGLMVVGKNRYPAFNVTGTDKVKFYFSGSAGTAGYPQIEVYEVGAEAPIATATGDIALTKSTWDKSTLLIAEGLDKAKSYKIVARTMNKVDDTTFGYEGGDIVLQVVKIYGDQAPMREDGVIISGSEIGNYINAHLAAYPEVTNFTLEGSGKYTITEGIVSSGKITLSGSASAPATIDASALAAPFMKFEGGTEYAQKPVVDAETGETTYEASSFFDVPEVTIANVKITGLAQSLINDAQKSLFTVINITNDNIEFAGSNSIFAINGFPTNLNINKSTLWSKEGHKGFLFQIQGRPMKDFAADATATFTIDQSTLFQIGVGKKLNNNNSGIKGQTCLHLNLTKSILVNTGTSTGNEINGWLFGQNSPAPTVTYDKNTYWTLGTKEVTNEETGETTTESISEIVPGWTDESKVGYDASETQLTTAPFALANALAGTFTVGASSQQAKFQTGDPRWLVPYATDAIKLEVDKSENTDFIAAINAALAESEAPSSITVTFYEAGEYPTTAELNTMSPITFQVQDIEAGEATIVAKHGFTLGGAINFNGVNIDASGLTTPFITLQGDPYKLQDNGFYNFGTIKLNNLKAFGMQGDLIYGNKVKNFITEIETKNSEIYMGAANKTVYNFNGGGVVKTWNFVNSTLDAGLSYIYSSQSGQKLTEVEANGQQTLNIQNATIINPAKKAFQHRQAGQTWLRYILKNSIVFVNGDKPNFAAEMNAGGTSANPVWDVNGNAFLLNTADGLTDASASQNTGDSNEPVKSNIELSSASFPGLAEDNFDGTLFTQKPISANPGDPRWNVELTFKPTIALYIYNAYSGKFLSRGDAWGTRAVGDDYGLPFNVTEADGKYSLNLIDWEGTCYGDDYWMYADCSGDRARTYTMESTNGGFFLHNTNRADVADNRMYIYLKDDADKYAIAGNAIVGDTEDANCANEAQAVWTFLSQDERDAIVQANDLLQNAKALIAAGLEDANIDELETGAETELTFKTGSAWTFAAKRNGSNAVTNDYGTEIYQGTGSFTQTVEGLKPGLYLVGVQAFYRDGWNEKVAELYKKGYNLSTVYLDANGYKAQIESWGADCTAVTDEEGNITGYKPNSMAEAADAFGEEKYGSGILAYVGEDGKLNLTLTVPTFNNGGWFIADNVTFAKLSEPASAAGDVTYALVEGDAFTSGQIVEVKIDDAVVATIQYGEEGGADFNAAVADNNAAEWGYTASTGGNGTNGNKAGGTFYTITPVYDGVVAAAVILNADKKFHLTVDGEQNPVFDNNTVSEKYYGPVEFNVAAGKAYKFYCDGSKLGFYGFNYKFGPDVEAITELSIAEQIVTLGIENVQTTTANNGVIYNLNGQKVQNAQKGLYIINGKKYLVK